MQQPVESSPQEKQQTTFKSEDHQRALITIPIHQQLSKFLWIKGLNNYHSQQQTTNAIGIFLQKPKALVGGNGGGNGGEMMNSSSSPSSESKYTFGSTQYLEEQDVERLYLFMGFNTWYRDQTDVPFVEFTRLTKIHHCSDHQQQQRNSLCDDRNNSSSGDDDERVLNNNKIEASSGYDDDDDDEWSDLAEQDSSIEIDNVQVDSKVSEMVEEMRAEQEKIAHQSLVQPKQINSTVFSRKSHKPPGRLFHSVCEDDRNGDVYVYGGFSAQRTPCTLITKFSLKTNEDNTATTFTVTDLTSSFKLVGQTEANDKTGRSPFREGHTAIVRKGKMYVLAGNAQRLGTFEKEMLEFDLETGIIKPIQTISRGCPFSPRAYHSATYISKRDVMIVYGGKLKPGPQSNVSNELFIFHFKTLTWEKVEMSNIEFPYLSGHKVFRFNNDNVGIIGGVCKPYSEELPDLNSKLFIYNLEYNTFTSIDLAPYGYVGRYSMPAAFSERNQMLAIGAGHISYMEKLFTVIYFDSVNVNYEHFNKPLLSNNSFTDVVIVCIDH